MRKIKMVLNAKKDESRKNKTYQIKVYVYLKGKKQMNFKNTVMEGSAMHASPAMQIEANPDCN